MSCSSARWQPGTWLFSSSGLLVLAKLEQSSHKDDERNEMTVELSLREQKLGEHIIQSCSVSCQHYKTRWLQTESDCHHNSLVFYFLLQHSLHWNKWDLSKKKKRSHFSKLIFLCNWSLIKWIWHTVTWHTVRTIIIIKFKLPGLFFFQSVSGPVLCEAPVGGVAGFYDPVCRRWHPGL